jgi:hypothetical protein
MGNLLSLLRREPEGVRPDYGLTGAQISPQRSAYEPTLAPGETRSREDLLSMLAGVIEAAGMAVVPGVGPRKLEQQAPARVRPGAEKPFAEWFGKSKVTDETGAPLTVYHGTNDAITQFEHGRSGKKDPGWLGTGFYFTNRPDIAGDYTTLKSGNSPNVMPAHLRIQNPLIVGPDAKEPLMLAAKRGDTEAATRRTRELKALGYDGVIMEYGAYSPGTREYMVFDPGQIKSATGNRGTYSPKSEDIRE